MARNVQIVTGAFGYSGKYIAKRLLELGKQVCTLTNSAGRANSFSGAVPAYPYNFADQEKLIASMRGATVLYNTYWVRFNQAGFWHGQAVENTLKLFQAAQKAGIERIVHISITNPAEDSPLEYFSGKARLEKALKESGISYAILRPAVLFGKEDILINNIAWLLRKFPVFGLFGDGSYRLQPIYVDDLAKLAVALGAARENRIIQAVGPETFTYRELVQKIGEIIGRPRPVISMPDSIGYLTGYLVGKIMGDVVITKEEIAGLKANLLYVEGAPPAGETKLTEWAKANAKTLGLRYAGELARRRNREESYEKL